MRAARPKPSASPLADGTLVKLPVEPDSALIPSLLTLADVLGTGYHAVLEAIGHMPAYEQTVGVVRPGGTISRVGVPQYADASVGFGSLFGPKTVGCTRYARDAPLERLIGHYYFSGHGPSPSAARGVYLQV